MTAPRLDEDLGRGTRLCAALALLAAGCGILDEAPNAPGPAPHGGTGEFRPLTEAETGIAGTPPGRALFSGRTDAFDSGQVSASGLLFYAAAPLSADPPPAPDPRVPGEVDWAAFRPRRVLRSAPTDLAGFLAGEVVLEAAEPWEGAALFEPGALERPDGSVLLYYAAEGGIGVARAPSLQGTFVRVATAPVVTSTSATAPRRPSAVGLGDEVLLYFESAGGIGLATSADGVAFTVVTEALELGADVIDDGSSEVSVGGPGAVVVRTPAGRDVVRVYFESRRDDGRRLVLLAASADGRAFERFERAVIADEDRRLPAPLVVDSRTTLLYLTAPRLQSDREVRALIATVAPRTVRFD